MSGSPQVRDYDDTLHVPPQQLVYATAAPIFIGFIVATALWGVASAQSTFYFRRHAQDSIQIRTIVIVIISLEAFHFAATTHGAYFTMINCRLNIISLNRPVWSLLIQAVPSALIVAIVRYVWIMRLWILNRSHRKNIIAGVMITLAVIEAGMTMGWMIAAFTEPFWGEVEGAVWPITIVFFLRAFNDISVTALFCYYLSRARSGFPGTDSVIKTMIRYSLGSGFFVCLGSIGLILVLTLMPTHAWFIAIYVAFTRVYANSLIAMLNWRRPWAQDFRAPEADEIELSTHWVCQSPPESVLMDPESNDTCQ